MNIKTRTVGLSVLLSIAAATAVTILMPEPRTQLASFEDRSHPNLQAEIQTLQSQLAEQRAAIRTFSRARDRSGRYANQTSVDTLTQQLAQLEMTVNQLSEHVSEAGPVLTENREADWIDSDESSLAEEQLDQAAALAEATSEHFARVDERFQSQSPDRDWERTAVNAITDGLQDDAMAGSDVTTMQCRSGMCRLELIHDDIVEMTAFIEHFGEALSEVAPSMAMNKVVNDDGSVSSIVYLAQDALMLSGR
ncbi:MAG: hypothetical protein AAF493_04875 [Pseudomonadota bacterium]